MAGGTLIRARRPFRTPPASAATLQPPHHLARSGGGFGSAASCESPQPEAWQTGPSPRQAWPAKPNSGPEPNLQPELEPEPEPEQPARREPPQVEAPPLAAPEPEPEPAPELELELSQWAASPSSWEWSEERVYTPHGVERAWQRRPLSAERGRAPRRHSEPEPTAGPKRRGKKKKHKKGRRRRRKQKQKGDGGVEEAGQEEEAHEGEEAAAQAEAERRPAVAEPS